MELAELLDAVGFRLILQAGRAIEFQVDAGLQDLGQIPNVGVALDVTNRDLVGGHAEGDHQFGLLQATGAGRGVGVDRATGLDGRDSRGLDAFALELGDFAVGGSDLDDAGLVGEALNEWPGIVVLVDALGDVGVDQFGDLVDAVARDPMGLRLEVVLLLVEAES